MPPSVAAVIVYHESSATILDCVRSLAAQTVPSVETVVVANSPIPDTVAEGIGETGASILHLGGNRGFAAACNAGAVRATTQYLLFVNPDICCPNDLVEQLVRFAGPSRAVGPAVQLPDGLPEQSVKMDTYLSAATLLLRELHVGRLLGLGARCLPVSAERVEILSGACVLVPRRMFWAIGGFDEQFFLYGEDVDLSLRLRQAGCELVYTPEVSVTHRSGRGSGGDSPPNEVLRIKGREARRAHALLLEKHRDLRTARRYVRLLPIVLRLRLSVARLAKQQSQIARDEAALLWLREARIS